VNDRGEVVGSSLTTDGQTHGFLWRDGAMIDLGTLGGSRSVAVAVNNLGQIVGESSTAGDLESHAVLWSIGPPSLPPPNVAVSTTPP